MKKSAKIYLSIFMLLVSGLFFINPSLRGQETPHVSSSLPAEINAMVTGSCMPCHGSSGGLMSRSKLNFTNWAEYAPGK